MTAHGIEILAMLLTMLLCFTGESYARMYIDINAPSVRKFKIAIPDFKNLSGPDQCAELATKLPAVMTGDLDLSGYFSPIDKSAFLVKVPPLTGDEIRFKNWSVIGAELLVTGGYTCIGDSVEVQARLFDVFSGRQIVGLRALGKTGNYRYIMHRVGNEFIKALTGQEGIFLTRFAFVGNATGNKEIYICDFDGHHIQKITSDRSIDLFPRWSPDGKWLVYTSYKAGGPMLYLRKMSNGNVRLLSGRKGLNIRASWMPDGRDLGLTLSTNGNPDIYTINMKGKILKRLTHHWGIDVSPTFSPDGKKVAFVSNRSGSPQIYTMDLATGTKQRITFDGKYNTSPCWSSQNRIAFASMNHGNFDIVTMNPDGGDMRTLTENQGNNESPSWSPGGHYLAFSSSREGKYHLYIMTAYGQNQRRITFMKGAQTSPSWGP